jgi:acetyl esterase/lipase
MRQQNIKITWFGVEREVPLPAGAALASPWLDIVQSLPSWKNNTHWDYLPSPSVIAEREPPPDSVWPASPPRKHLYIDDAYMLHPFASLQLAQSWEGSPPIYVSTGWECLADEDRYLVSKLTKEGVPVVFEEYEAMPHVFAPILSQTPQSKRCYEGWAKFITAAVENPQSIKSSYTTIKARTCKEVDADPAKLSPFAEDDLRKLAFEMAGRKLPIAEVPAKL